MITYSRWELICLSKRGPECILYGEVTKNINNKILLVETVDVLGGTAYKFWQGRR